MRRSQTSRRRPAANRRPDERLATTRPHALRTRPVTRAVRRSEKATRSVGRSRRPLRTALGPNNKARQGAVDQERALLRSRRGAVGGREPGVQRVEAVAKDAVGGGMELAVARPHEPPRTSVRVAPCPGRQRHLQCAGSGVWTTVWVESSTPSRFGEILAAGALSCTPP